MHILTEFREWHLIKLLRIFIPAHFNNTWMLRTSVLVRFIVGRCMRVFAVQKINIIFIIWYEKLGWCWWSSRSGRRCRRRFWGWRSWRWLVKTEIIVKWVAFVHTVETNFCFLAGGGRSDCSLLLLVMCFFALFVVTAKFAAQKTREKSSGVHIAGKSIFVGNDQEIGGFKLIPN